MKETQNSMDHLLFAVNNQEQKWLIFGDLKVGTQSVIVICVSWTARLTTNILSDRSGR